MRKANIFVDDVLAGELREVERGKHYQFVYLDSYKGLSVSLTMPRGQLLYEFSRFPPFFEGVLPEGFMLDSLLKRSKIDRDDLLSQLIQVGGDLVGNVTVKASE